MKMPGFTLLVALVALMASACTGLNSTEEATIPVAFNLTDAPVDSANIAHVYVKFGGLEINESGSAWINVPIDSDTEYDLLSLTEGVSALMGNVTLVAGSQINQIRFLDPTITILETGATSPVTCTLASATGLKIVNSFAVPLSGSLSLTVDFDVRKSLVYTAGNGAAAGYRMKPVLRAVVDGEAGKITGTLAAGYAVYAYKAGTYDATLGDPATVDQPEFSHAYTSTKADGNYTLAFLEAGSYDLVVADIDSSDGTTPTFVATATPATSVEVTSAQPTPFAITLPATTP